MTLTELYLYVIKVRIKYRVRYTILDILKRSKRHINQRSFTNIRVTIKSKHCNKFLMIIKIKPLDKTYSSYFFNQIGSLDPEFIATKLYACTENA